MDSDEHILEECMRRCRQGGPLMSLYEHMGDIYKKRKCQAMAASCYSSAAKNATEHTNGVRLHWAAQVLFRESNCLNSALEELNSIHEKCKSVNDHFTATVIFEIMKLLCVTANISDAWRARIISK